jgi:hypothetical protein
MPNSNFKIINKERSNRMEDSKYKNKLLAIKKKVKPVDWESFDVFDWISDFGKSSVQNNLDDGWAAEHNYTIDDHYHDLLYPCCVEQGDYCSTKIGMQSLFLSVYKEYLYSNIEGIIEAIKVVQPDADPVKVSAQIERLFPTKNQ